MSEIIDPSKLKVAELRAELQARGIDSKGNKPVLIERLKEALDEESGTISEGAAEGKELVEHNSDVEEQESDTQEQMPEAAEQEPDEPVLELETEQDFEKEEHEEPALELEPERDLDAEIEAEPEQTKAENCSNVQEPFAAKEEESHTEKEESFEKEPSIETQQIKSDNVEETEQARDEFSPSKRYKDDDDDDEEEEEEEDPTGRRRKNKRRRSEADYSSPRKVTEYDEPESSEEREDEAIPAEQEGNYKEDADTDMSNHNDATKAVDNEVKTEEELEINKEEAEQQKEDEAADEEKRGEKRQRSSRSRSHSPESKKHRPEVEEICVEDEPGRDCSAVLLDWYNSDLSLIINRDDFLTAQPLTMQGFGYVWHGVRATYGFTRGRVFFEVKVVELLPVPHLEDDEQHPHVVRVGWSIDEAGLTLGEDPFSYGYDGLAKASTNLKFKDYGKTFGKGDVIGCYLDLEAEPIVLSFTVNGEDQGTAYEIPHTTLGERALFPHIVTKNCSFKVNFGTEDPWFSPLTRYTYVGDISQQDRAEGGKGPASREEAEVIMMVGLPACGKTVWVEKYCRENPEKKYYVLGTNFLIDKMKVNGKPRKENFSGKWDVLIERCTKCLNKLLEMSYRRRRNFIIDQTNVYPSAQRRKMKGFAGFYRRAVVICPSDENLKKRSEKREKEEGKDVPDKAVLEMKANFKLPEEGELFDAVEFVEQQREDATKVVSQYNKEGETAGFGQKKNFRGGFHDRRGGFMENRGGYGNRGNSNYRGNWDRDRRGGGNDRRDRGGNWNRDRDNRDYNRSYGGRGGYNRDNRAGRDNNRGYIKDRGGRNNYYNDWNRGSSYENKSTHNTTASTNSWDTTHQGQQSSQGYGNYYNQGSSSWGGQPSSSGYSQGSYNQNYNQGWNQQYYQQQQQYWGQQQNYGGYGQHQGYGSSSSHHNSGYNQHQQQSSSGWGNNHSQSGWGNQGGGSWGSNYNSYQRR